MKALIDGSTVIFAGLSDEASFDVTSGLLADGQFQTFVTGVTAPLIIPCDVAPDPTIPMECYKVVNGKVMLDTTTLMALVQTLASNRSIMFNMRRDAKISEGYQHASGQTLQTGPDDQINWLGLMLQASSNPTGSFTVRTLENENLTMTGAEVIAMLSAMAAWKAGIVFGCAAAKDAMKAAATPQDALAVDFNP